jgi:hypothetical protein
MRSALAAFAAVAPVMSVKPRLAPAVPDIVGAARTVPVATTVTTSRSPTAGVNAPLA